jgi:uncharacterized protein with HEPN domain
MYLEHIRECVRRIEEYTSEGRERFMQSGLVQDAVMRNFEIIGEAVKQISDATRRKAPQVPWTRIAGFRDVLIHGYMGVDLDEVWSVVEKHLPELRLATERLLAG